MLMSLQKDGGESDPWFTRFNESVINFNNNNNDNNSNNNNNNNNSLPLLLHLAISATCLRQRRLDLIGLIFFSVIVVCC
jgi:hypothetical protein